MTKPRLIRVDDDQWILDAGERLSAPQAEQYQQLLTAAMKDKRGVLAVGGEQGWDVVDLRKPDILKRLERVERWIKRHDKARPGSEG